MAPDPLGVVSAECCQYSGDDKCLHEGSAGGFTLRMLGLDTMRMNRAKERKAELRAEAVSHSERHREEEGRDAHQ